MWGDNLLIHSQFDKLVSLNLHSAPAIINIGIAKQLLVAMWLCTTLSREILDIIYEFQWLKFALRNSIEAIFLYA